MRLGVLSRSPRIHTTRRLVEAARARGHRALVIDPLEVELGLGGAGPALARGGRPFPALDAVLPRVGASAHHYGLAVVQQLALQGVALLNGPTAIAASRDVMQALQRLAAAGVPVPPTAMASGAGGVRAMVRRVGGLPVLAKLLRTGERGGVMVCETLQSLEAALEAVRGLGQDLVVQRYLRGAHGRDLRALVVGGEVVAALRRSPRVGRMARSLRRGATFEPVELPPATRRIAARAARVLGLEACAVDMLDAEGGPVVFEVNSSPSIREAEQACGVDVAGAMVDRAVALAGAARRRAG